MQCLGSVVRVRSVVLVGAAWGASSYISSVTATSTVQTAQTRPTTSVVSQHSYALIVLSH